MSAAEWEKIKKESGIVENNGEAHRVQEDEEPEPVATPTKQYPQVGQMQAAKGGKPAGAVTEWESHAGYDAESGEPTDDSFESRHPTLAKAVDIGKKAAGKVNEFVEEEMIHHGAAERKKPTEEEKKEEKKKTQKELSRIEKEIQGGFLGEDGEEEKDEKTKKKKDEDDKDGKTKKKKDEDEDKESDKKSKNPRVKASGFTSV